LGRTIDQALLLTVNSLLPQTFRMIAVPNILGALLPQIADRRPVVTELNVTVWLDEEISQ